MADEVTERRQADETAAPRRRAKRSPNGQARSVLCVQLTSEERALLEAKAANAGHSMSRVLVTSALRASTSEVINGTDLDRLNEELTVCRRQLIGVAGNLNQLSHHANATMEFPRDASQVLAQVRETLFEIQDLIESVKR
jgi:uncharacterized protein (DUF1778 family)